MVIFQVSQGTELLKSVDLYLGDDLVMAGHWAMALGRASTLSLLIHTKDLKSMSLCAT